MTAPRNAGRPRIDGLDGLRAIAVVGVLLYHGDVPWAHGGFIGVDVFFVLSGYLVTSIVLESFAKTGALGFGRFWRSRLRRLAPAQITLLVAVTVAMAVLHHDELGGLRGQVIAALTATTNWYLIATNGSYFEQLGRPVVLRHLWSLAVEVQFYLVFPPLLILALRRWGQRLDRVLIGLGVAILASTLYLAFLYHPGTDPTRAYFDTFGRFAAPLVGAALAVIWRPVAVRRGAVAQAGPAIGAAGVAALLGLVWAMHVANDRGAFMYRGGFLLVALLSAVIVAAIVHPGAVLGGRRVLGHPVLVAIGLRSYGLYLWHWPIYVLLRPGIDVGWSWGVTVFVRLGLTILCTELCYRFIERPWHLRSPDASFAGLRRRLLQPSGIPTRTRVATLSGVFLLVVAIVILALPHKQNTVIANSLDEGQAALDRANARASATSIVGTTVTTTVPRSTAGDPGLLPDDGRVTMVGDSVMLGAAPDLLAAFGDKGNVDARVARQAASLAPVIKQLGVEGRLGTTVVVQVGINGTVTEEDLHAVSEAAAGRRLVIINARVPRPWEQGNRATVARVVPTLPHASIIDWYKLSNGKRDWYLNDGVHLTEPGRAAYTAAIQKAVTKARAAD